MVVAAIAARPHVTGSSPPAVQKVVAKKPRRSLGTWVMIGVPLLLGLTFVWQIASNILHTEIAVRDAVAVSKVSLEAHPMGSRVDLVLVDRIGQDTTVNGQVNIKLREPDGTLWQTTRSVTASDFGALPAGGLLAGRTGYSVIIPAADWLRAPRRGGSATVNISVQRADGTGFTTVADERFP
jgi:hypothetical protein